MLQSTLECCTNYMTLRIWKLDTIFFPSHGFEYENPKDLTINIKQAYERSTKPHTACTPKATSSQYTNLPPVVVVVVAAPLARRLMRFADSPKLQRCVVMRKTTAALIRFMVTCRTRSLRRSPSRPSTPSSRSKNLWPRLAYG